MHNIIKEKFIKYFARILFFIIVFHVIVRPVQTALNKKLIAPIIIEKLDTMGANLTLHALKNHIYIYKKINNEEVTVLNFSMPFGQFYFFLIIFLWFKPPLLIRTISLYNIMLIPSYLLAVLMFLNGFKIFGQILILHEKIYRIIYFFIFSLKIFRPKQFKVIFSN
tara:strand:- start:3272 stop:3769 length:498 start_codon:yes stop_codon:yes gene_type:complete